MALTRPRYSQIPDSDYKNSCRIVTTTDITLTGAPLTYDGITLVQFDRVLVAGQTDKTKNGIYSVLVLGTGSNGTWIRSKDANADDRLTAGMNTFIEEGTYTGQFWHLLTPGPIVLGVSELIFGQITGNAAGISSQIQYNLNGSIAGSANLRYDSVTGNVLIGGGTAATSNVSGALTVNGGIGITGEVWTQGNMYSRGSRVLTAYDLQTVTFTANYISKDPANVAVPVVGTGTIYGTHNFGNLEAISTYGDYNTTNSSGYYSVNDASGAPGFIVYVGFTGITSFNRAVFNINYTQQSGHTVTLDFYNYDTDAWDPFATYSGLGNWQAFTLGVIDANPYIDATGNVTTRIYHVSSGNTAHRTWIDYVALEQSITGGQGPRGATGATGATGAAGTYTGGFIIGNVVVGNTIISNSGNVSVSTTTGAIILTGDGGAGIGGNIFAGGNITANAFYTLNGLFWSGNGLAFSSGLEVSEINAANTLSNISTQVTSIRFDKDTGFSVSELNPGNIKVSLGSSFKTWHVPGQADLVAAAEDEVTFFGNGIDITTHPTAPKSITFIANNSVLQANLGAFQIYANANIGTLFLGNLSTQANLGAYQIWANNQIEGAFSEISALDSATEANAATQAAAINTLNANIGAFYTYANTKIGTNTNSNLVVASTTDSVSAITGALVVAGGVGIGGNLYVAGNIFASNLISINSTTLSVTDPLLYLNADSPFPYNYDIGFFSHFVGGGPTSHYQHTGIVRDYTNSIWNFFSNVSSEPGATIDWAEANIIYDTARLGGLIVANTTSSTSTTTGALQVAGGAGIGGALYITNTGDVSANIGTIKTDLATLNSNVGAFETYANIYLGTTTTFDITDAGSSQYEINGQNNPALYLIRGQKYNFSVNAIGHPLWIKTAVSLGISDQYNSGVFNNGEDNGIVSFEVPLNAPSILYYVSQFDIAMSNQLIIVNFNTLDANIGNLYLGNASTQANLGAFQTYSNTTFTALDANIGTLFLGNASTQANLGAFQTYANLTFGTSTYSNANVTAYLPIHTGNIAAGNVIVTSNVTADKFYTTDGIYWSGNGAAYAAGSGGSSFTYTASTTPPVGPVVGDQWYDTADGILYEYMADGDTDQWVDIISSAFSSADLTSYGVDVEFRSNISVAGNTFVGDGIYWAGNGEAFASTVYSNANVTAYLTTGTGNIAVGNILTNNYLFANGVNILSTTVGTYSNANVVSMLAANTSVRIGTGVTNSNVTINATRSLPWDQNALQIEDATVASQGGQTRIGQNWYTNSGNKFIGSGYATLMEMSGTDASLKYYVSSASGTADNSVTFQNILSLSQNSNLTIGVSGIGNVVVGNVFAGGNIRTTSTSTSTSTTTGALVISGGAGIAGNVYVNGNVILGSGTASNLVANATTTSTSSTTGALVVRGGAGIAGNLYAVSNVILGSSTTSNVVVAATTTSTSTTTGALVVAGGTGIAGRLNVAGNVVISSGTASTTSTSGALVITGTGGLAVGGVITSAGNIVAASSQSSTSTTTGGLVVKGGMGVAGNVYSGNVYTTSGVYWAGNNAVYGSQNIFTASSTVPSSSTVGDFWYYTTDDILLQYVTDGTSSYWLDIQSPSHTSNVSSEYYLGNTTVGGNVTITANMVVGGNVTIQSSIVETDYAVIDTLGGSSTVTLSPLNGTMQRWTLVASRSAQFANFFNGGSMTLMIVATAYSISSWTGVSWIGGSAPALSNSTTTVLEFWKSGGTLYGGLVGST